MSFLPFNKPTDDKVFQKLCVALYSAVWNDTNLKEFGRPGQAQHGIDLFYGTRNEKRVCIQCKRVVNGGSAESLYRFHTEETPLLVQSTMLPRGTTLLC